MDDTISNHSKIESFHWFGRTFSFENMDDLIAYGFTVTFE